MTLQAGIKWIQDRAATLPGVGSAPSNPTETASSSLIFTIAYPSSGEVRSASSGWGANYDNIIVNILTARGDLFEAMKRLEGFPHNLARLIQEDVTLNGNVATFENITYQWVAMTFNGVDHVGYILTLNGVKTLTTF